MPTADKTKRPHQRLTFTEFWRLQYLARNADVRALAADYVAARASWLEAEKAILASKHYDEAMLERCEAARKRKEALEGSLWTYSDSPLSLVHLVGDDAFTNAQLILESVLRGDDAHLWFDAGGDVLAFSFTHLKDVALEALTVVAKAPGRVVAEIDLDKPLDVIQKELAYLHAQAQDPFAGNLLQNKAAVEDALDASASLLKQGQATYESSATWRAVGLYRWDRKYRGIESEEINAILKEQFSDKDLSVFLSATAQCIDQGLVLGLGAKTPVK